MKIRPQRLLEWILLLVWLGPIWIVGLAQAQPYFDVASIQYWNGPSYFSPDSSGESYFSAGVSIPIQLGSGKSLLVSPQYDTRELSGFNGVTSNQLQSASLPISFLWFASDSAWMMNITAINRINSNGSLQFEDSWQTGGAVVISRQFKNRLWIRAGAYYNREFFSDYFLPLLGCDWRITERWRLFGVMPSNIRLQHQISAHSNIGLSFRSFTNSYRKSSKGYVKLYDNHLFLYADKRIYGSLVGVVELGYSAFKKVWSRDADVQQLVESSGPLVKCGLFYRIPLP